MPHSAARCFPAVLPLEPDAGRVRNRPGVPLSRDAQAALRTTRPPERFGLFGLAELSSGRHDRRQVTIGLEEFQRVRDVVNVALEIKGDRIPAPLKAAPRSLRQAARGYLRPQGSAYFLWSRVVHRLRSCDLSFHSDAFARAIDQRW